MDTTTLDMLEFDKIKEQLKTYCVSGLGKERCERLKPETDPRRIVLALAETTESLIIVGAGGQPLHGLHDIREALTTAEKGAILAPKDLLRIADVLRGAAKFKKLMRTKSKEMPLISAYSESIADLEGIVEAVVTSIEGERVSDHADDDLRKVRREIKQTEARIEQRLNSILKSMSTRDSVQDGFVTVKGGRWVIPVKASSRGSVPGTVVAASSSGQTVFIEPAQVQPLMDRLVSLRVQEEELVYQVLCALTALIVDRLTEIRITMEAMATCDFIFAKGRYSLDISGVALDITVDGPVYLEGARHPLLGKDAVPVDIRVGDGYRTLVITGPNTGGKTVLLKTVGLLSVMVQSGLHISAKPGGMMPVFRDIFADIGDRQSIEQSLSTFSSHMSNIAAILQKARSGSLVLLDEIGTGTDPREGAALAAAVLDYLYRQGCITLATTHYGDVKTYSENHVGFMNGCMEFDHDTLKPLFRLIIGQSGQSQGLVIARRLGLPREVVHMAEDYVGWMAPDEATGNSEKAPALGAPGRAGNVLFHEISSGVRESMLHKDTAKACGVGSRRDMPGSAASGRPRKPEIVRLELPTDTEARPKPSAGLPREKQFLRGDSVFVYTVKDSGIVAREADERGNVVVLVRDRRISVHRKRLKLLVKREDLYPGEDYDLDIVLMSKKDRKLKKTMSKRPTDEARVIEPDPEPE